MGFNVTSLLGSAAYSIGDVVWSRADVSNKYSANVVFAPYTVQDIQCEPVSMHSTTADSGYTFAYQIDYAGTYRTGGLTTKTEYQLLTKASALLLAKLSISGWTSAPTT